MKTIIIFLLSTSFGFSQIPEKVSQTFQNNVAESFEKIISIQQNDKLYFFTDGRYQLTSSLSSEKELSGDEVKLIASDYYTKLFASLNTNPGDINVKAIIYIYIQEKGRKKKIDRIFLFIERYVIGYNFHSFHTQTK